MVIRDFAFPILLGSDFLRYVYALILYGDGTVTFQSPRFRSTVTLPIFSVANDQVRPDFVVNLSSGQSVVFVLFLPSCTLQPLF